VLRDVEAVVCCVNQVSIFKNLWGVASRRATMESMSSSTDCRDCRRFRYQSSL
jgi:hypothetical protein